MTVRSSQGRLADIAQQLVTQIEALSQAAASPYSTGLLQRTLGIVRVKRRLHRPLSRTTIGTNGTPESSAQTVALLGISLPAVAVRILLEYFSAQSESLRS